MKDICQKTIKILMENLGSLLVFIIAYGCGYYLIAIQSIRLAVQGSLAWIGYSNLTEENYADFLCNPMTLFLFLVTGVLLLLLLTIEIAGLLVCYQCSWENRKIYVSDIFFLGIRQTIRFVKKHPLEWLCLAFGCIMFLELPFLLIEASYIKMIQYTAVMFYKLLPSITFWILCLCTLLGIAYVAVLLLTQCLLRETSLSEGMKNVRDNWKGRVGKVLMGASLAEGTAALVIEIFYLLIMMSLVFLVMQTQPIEIQTAKLIVYSDKISILIGMVAGMVSMTAGTAFTFALQKDPAIIDAHASLWRTPIVVPGFGKMRRGRKVAVGTMAVLLLEFLGGCYLLYHGTEITGDMLTGTVVTAHRGGAKEAPENTLSALSYAMNETADYAEIDVQETKDGVVVLLHDNSLRRTTGLNKKIWDVNYEELKRLDAGAYFGAAYRGEKIPTLQEAIDFCDGKLKLNIEVKYNGENKYLVDKVVRIMEENHIVNSSILSSMNYAFLTKAKKLNPDIQTSYVMHMTYGGLENLEYADDFSIKSTYIDQKIVEEAHGLGKEIHAWTINSVWGVERMKYYGVDNLITDNPTMARKVMSGEKTQNTGFWEASCIVVANSDLKFKIAY